MSDTISDPLIACCGVDCAPCPDFTPGRCPGCRASEWPEGEVCMPVRCCRERGIACCGECESFPCADMRDFYEESPGHRAAFRRMNELRQRPRP